MVLRTLVTLFLLVLGGVSHSAVFTVTNANDGGAGSFRQAILNSNATVPTPPTGRNIIIFDIPVNPMFPIPPVIAPTSPLPDITTRVLIDASTNQTTGRAGLSGANAGMDTDGLRLVAPVERCTIRGLVIFGFLGNGDGIEINDSDGNDIEGCRIGLDPLTGGLDIGNGGAGVHIANGSDNTIGGTTVAQRNVISGNGANGVWIIGASSTGNRVIGNYIGTNVAGSVAVPNVTSGVRIASCPGNFVGGPTTAERNLISGNQVGVTIAGANARGNVVQGNFIGTDATGFADLGNQVDGIRLESAEATIIGGTPAFTFLHGSPPGNLISGNGMAGIRIQSASTVWIMGNGIGAGISGTTDIGNGQDGIRVEKEPLGLPPRNVVIGGSFAAGNLLRFNDFDGIWIADGTGTLVQGNLIQQNDDDGIHITDSDGNIIGGPGPNQGKGAPTSLTNHIFDNANNGIRVNNCSDNLIGGVAITDGNFIYGNGEHGIRIVGGATRTRIQGCLIGADALGMIRPNGEFGVAILDAPENFVGGPGEGEGNSIVGNLLGGVLISEPSSANNRVQGNGIGFDAALTKGVLGNGYGVFIDNAPDNLIGGVVSGASNVITENTSSGIGVVGGAAARNKIQGNFIGLAPGGVDLGNGGSGVEIIDAPETLIGGNISAARNVIGANDGDGISISGGGLSAGTVIQGNYIGLDESGVLGNRGNQRNGIYAHAAGLVVGGNTPAERNLISSNGSNGVNLSGAATTGCVVAGNFIGTDVSGSSGRGNNADGVFLEAADGNVIGGTQPGTANVIAANDGNGIRLAAHANNNRIWGNNIGTYADGTDVLENLKSGVLIQDAVDNRIGGPEPGARNILSGPNEYGVRIDSPEAKGNRIEGNFIGTDITGTLDFGNRFGGVLIVDASDNFIGGAEAGMGNLISGNGGSGIQMMKTMRTPGRTLIQGNRIGTDVNGTVSLGNMSRGIDLSAAVGVVIGGTTEGARNLISGNGFSGVLFHDEARECLVQGNFIGTDITGTLPLGNFFDGVFLENAPNSLVGGATPGAGNLISGNGTYGIHLLDSDATGNLVQGNLIGTDLSGIADIGNASAGIYIKAATGNILGGTGAGEGNLVAFNQAGVDILSGSMNPILTNSIFSNDGLGIDLGEDGLTANDDIDSDTGANDFQNFPIIVSATVTATGTTVNGTLRSATATEFLIQIFANDICDASGFGEGQAFIGSVTATTDNSGAADFVVETPQTFASVTYLTGAATSPEGNTSEFGPCFESIPPPTATPTFTATLTPTATHTPGEPTATFTPTITPGGPTLTFTPTLTPGGPTLTPTPTGTCSGQRDLTGEGSVNAIDLLLLLSDQRTGDPRSDLDCDGQVDENDLFLFSQEWATAP